MQQELLIPVGKGWKIKQLMPIKLLLELCVYTYQPRRVSHTGVKGIVHPKYDISDIGFLSMSVNGDQKLFFSLKYLHVQHKRKKCNTGLEKLEFVNNDRFF